MAESLDGEPGTASASDVPGAEDALRWEVWRQDDNGVRLLVDRFATRAAAEARIAAFEAHHHKQTYWIERGNA